MRFLAHWYGFMMQWTTYFFNCDEPLRLEPLVMSPKQIKMRQALMALYLEVPSEIAKDVTNVVMDAIEELEHKIKLLQTPPNEPCERKFPYGEDPNK